MRAPVRALVVVTVIAGIGWLARARVADVLTWRYAQRPTGRGARVLYGARRAEYDGLETVQTALALREGDRLVEIGPGGGFLAEAALARVLTPGGRLVVQTRSPQAHAVMRGVGLGWMARRLRFYDDDELTTMISRAGQLGRFPSTTRPLPSPTQAAPARRSCT